MFSRVHPSEKKKQTKGWMFAVVGTNLVPSFKLIASCVMSTLYLHNWFGLNLTASSESKKVEILRGQRNEELQPLVQVTIPRRQD